MKYAVIGHPDALAVSAVRRRGYHFALGQELLRSDGYLQFYKDARSNGSFIIVDNGAAEADTPPFSWVVAIAKSIDADEVILPDVLKDSEATFRSTCDYGVLSLVPAPRRFVVPQGDSWEEWGACLSKIVMNLDGRFATIGLAKHLERLQGGRARAMQMLKDRGLHVRFNVHMLGVWEDPWKEVNAVRAVWRGVRGIDSGLPIACAQRNEVMQTGRRHSLLWEPVENSGLAHHNIARMDILCREDKPEW